MNDKETVVIGDVHGHYKEFALILRSAGAADARLKWCGGDMTVIQMGDLIDKGPDSVRADNLADALQQQAAKVGGEFVRIIGNHELEIMLGNFMISDLKDKKAKEYQDKLRIGVLTGKYKAAYHKHGLLFTHAGVNGKILKLFKTELGVLSEAKVATLINNIFINSIKHNFYKHPIFNISHNRGGTDRYGGIFWEDLEDLYLSFPRSPLRQVVGHTMVNEIAINANKNVIAVDVGMYRLIQYLKIKPAGIEIVTVT